MDRQSFYDNKEMNYEGRVVGIRTDFNESTTVFIMAGNTLYQIGNEGGVKIARNRPKTSVLIPVSDPERLKVLLPLLISEVDQTVSKKAIQLLEQIINEPRKFNCEVNPTLDKELRDKHQ